MPAVVFSPQELWALSHIEETYHVRLAGTSVADDEMICQRDMKIRGVRLRAYHAKLGDLNAILGMAA